MSLGPLQIILIIVLILLLFGAGRLPRMMEDVAKGIKSFKKGIADDDTEQKQKISSAKTVEHDTEFTKIKEEEK